MPTSNVVLNYTRVQYTSRIDTLTRKISALHDMIEKYERNIYWYDFSPDGGNATLRPDVELSWYVLDKKQEVIIGPYPTNVTFLSDSNLSAHVNRWTHWRLVPRPEFSGNGRLSDDNYGVRCRWHLRLMNNFHRKIFSMLELTSMASISGSL